MWTYPAPSALSWDTKLLTGQGSTGWTASQMSPWHSANESPHDENFFSVTAVSTCQKGINSHNNSMHFETLLMHRILSTGHIHLTFSCFSCSQTRGTTVPLTILPGTGFYPLLPLCNPDTEAAWICRRGTIQLGKMSLPKDNDFFLIWNTILWGSILAWEALLAFSDTWLNFTIYTAFSSESVSRYSWALQGQGFLFSV